MGERRGVRGNSAFVVPTDFGSHSMLHQTLISSSSSSPSFSASASSSSSPFVFASSPFASTAAPSAFLRASAVSGSVVEKQGRMEALRSILRPEDAAEEMTALPAAWGVVERGGVPGEGFSVEDLLDLEEFCEAEKDGGEGVEAPVVGEDKACDSHESSDVSYELMPPPPTEIDLPAHDAEELEWVSRYMDDSNSELPPPPPPPPAAPMASLAAPRPLPPRQPRRPQEGAHRALPTAADPMRTPTICALSTEALVPVKAKRSKRARAAVWSLSGAAHFSDSTSSSSTTTTTSSCSSSASFSPFLLFETSAITASDLLFDDYNHLPPPPKKSKNGKNSRHKPKKRGRKPKQLPPQFAAAAATSPAAPGDRRCSHCGVQKTPQWRAGPEGAKTLCNACGVRYKSGRLLPEYRPACSPTFVSSIHSNSHRKVLEMRRKKEASLISASPPVASF